MTDIADHEARRIANKALTKIEGHEETCAERWQQARNQLSALFRGQRQTLYLMLSAQGAVILLLIGLLASIIMGRVT